VLLSGFSVDGEDSGVERHSGEAPKETVLPTGGGGISDAKRTRDKDTGEEVSYSGGIGSMPAGDSSGADTVVSGLF
jgi:hypothetical protein